VYTHVATPDSDELSSFSLGRSLPRRSCSSIVNQGLGVDSNNRNGISAVRRRRDVPASDAPLSLRLRGRDSIWGWGLAQRQR